MSDSRRWRFSLWPALALVFSLAGQGQAAPTRGPLTVSATPTRFADRDGRTVWLNGLMVCCGPFAQTNGWPWISRPMMDRLANAGGNWAYLRLGPYTRDGELSRFEAYQSAGGHVYDLDRWNEAFWTDLHDTVAYARDKGIYVEIDLIDGWVLEDEPDRFSPWKDGSNLQGVADDCTILHHPPAPHHVAWLEKVAHTVGEFDNVIFQVGNETSDCHGGGTSVDWEQGVIQTMRAALAYEGFGDRLFSTNSENGTVEGLTDVDYVNVHQPTAASIRARKPTGVNEYRETAFDDVNGYTFELWNAFARGTYFHYWRGDDDDATFDAVFPRITIFRKFLAGTGLAGFDEQPLGYRVVGHYGREYVAFVPGGESRAVDLGPSLQEFSVEWLDPRNGLVTQGASVTASGVQYFQAPAPTEVMRVLHLFIQDGCPGCVPPRLTGIGDGGAVRLDWATDYVGVRRFLLERKQEPSGPFVVIEQNLPPDSTSYADTVPSSGTWSYRVHVQYLTGGDGYSNTVTVTMFDAVPPNPPTNLKPASCAAWPPHFAWDAMPTATGYYIRASTVDGSVRLLANDSLVAPSYVPSPGELALFRAHIGEPILWSVNACNNRGCSPSWAQNQTITLRREIRADWNGDCKSDVLLRNDLTGDLSGWMLDGAAKIGETALTPARPVAGNWVAAGTSDFDDDGQGDVLWWNADSGNLSVWYLDGAVRRTGAAFTGIPDLRWRPAATGDLTGDRRADVIWRRTDTGQLSVGVQGPGGFTQQALSPSSTMDPAWELAAVGDLTGDRKPDLLWRNNATGALHYWAMDGLRQIGSGPITSAGVPGAGWRVVGIWPVDQDASADIVWQNANSRALVVWHMNGAAQASGEYFSPSATPMTLSAIGPR